MKDREYLQEMAYIEAEKKEIQEKELRELDQVRLPAKIIILKKDEHGNSRKIDQFTVDALPF